MTEDELRARTDWGDLRTVHWKESGLHRTNELFTKTGVVHEYVGSDGLGIVLELLGPSDTDSEELAAFQYEEENGVYGYLIFPGEIEWIE